MGVLEVFIALVVAVRIDLRQTEICVSPMCHASKPIYSRPKLASLWAGGPMAGTHMRLLYRTAGHFWISCRGDAQLPHLVISRRRLADGGHLYPLPLRLRRSTKNSTTAASAARAAMPPTRPPTMAITLDDEPPCGDGAGLDDEPPCVEGVRLMKSRPVAKGCIGQWAAMWGRPGLDDGPSRGEGAELNDGPPCGAGAGLDTGRPVAKG